MAEVYEVFPKAHRAAVTEIDAVDPSPALAIDARGKQVCRFDIALTGVALTLLTVAPIFWDEETESWITGEEHSFTAVGDYALLVDSSAGVLKLGWLFLKITAFTGTSFSFSADCLLS